MAVYRLGDMVRMRRESLGMTQGELIQIYDGRGRRAGGQINCTWLSDRGRTSSIQGEENEICSLQVLRRIENGGVKRVKINVFRQIMLKMGVLPERMYASLLVTEGHALSLKADIHVHINMGEYEAAERKLDELEGMLVPGYPRNEQYRMERRATIAYKKGELEAQEYLGILLDALRYTVPNLDEIDIAGWPFNMNEFDILSGIANAYHSMKAMETQAYYLSVAQGDIHAAERIKVLCDYFYPDAVKLLV